MGLPGIKDLRLNLEICGDLGFAAHLLGKDISFVSKEHEKAQFWVCDIGNGQTIALTNSAVIKERSYAPEGHIAHHGWILDQNHAPFPLHYFAFKELSPLYKKWVNCLNREGFPWVVGVGNLEGDKILIGSAYDGTLEELIEKKELTFIQKVDIACQIIFAFINLIEEKITHGKFTVDAFLYRKKVGAFGYKVALKPPYEGDFSLRPSNAFAPETLFLGRSPKEGELYQELRFSLGVVLLRLFTDISLPNDQEEFILNKVFIDLMLEKSRISWVNHESGVRELKICESDENIKDLKKLCDQIISDFKLVDKDHDSFVLEADESSIEQKPSQGHHAANKFHVALKEIREIFSESHLSRFNDALQVTNKNKKIIADLLQDLKEMGETFSRFNGLLHPKYLICIFSIIFYLKKTIFLKINEGDFSGLISKVKSSRLVIERVIPSFKEGSGKYQGDLYILADRLWEIMTSHFSTEPSKRRLRDRVLDRKLVTALQDRVDSILKNP